MLSKKYQLVQSVSARLFKVLVTWGVIAAVIIAAFIMRVDWVPVLIVTLGCGILGGLISLQRRVKTLSLVDLELLNGSWSHILLSPLTGGFLAALLYTIFISELLTSDLFPAFTLDPTDTARPGTVEFQDIIRVRANTVQDYAKLLVWSFIAGYSEKFVINIIGQFHSTALDRSNDDDAIDRGSDDTALDRGIDDTTFDRGIDDDAPEVQRKQLPRSPPKT